MRQELKVCAVTELARITLFCGLGALAVWLCCIVCPGIWADRADRADRAEQQANTEQYQQYQQYLQDQGSDYSDEQYIVGDAVTGDVASAEWYYGDMPMYKCAWCGRTVNLNRHHIIPQATAPEMRDVYTNLIVLCRDCHFVLGHRCNWKKYNPDVLSMVTIYTNCLPNVRRTND